MRSMDLTITELLVKILQGLLFEFGDSVAQTERDSQRDSQVICEHHKKEMRFLVLATTTTNVV